jgi:hypothetical protein
MCLSSQLGGKFKHRRVTVQACFGKKQDPIYQITRAKRAGGMAEAVEYLPCKHEVLPKKIRKRAK